MSRAVRVIPLGGIGEIGKNITVIEDDEQMILVDCGISFPRQEMLGVDIVLPDFTYVVQNRDKLAAVILTHGHEDHIGSLPYLMKKVDVPQVYGTRFTLALARSRADEHGLVDATEWIEIEPGEGEFDVGTFAIEPVRVAHSMPDCCALAIHTEHGTIVHTGDFKIDASPIDGVQTDLGRFGELGGEGVDLYLGDSTNADVPGHGKSERSITEPLRDIITRAPARVIACCFSSHIHRVQQLADIAHRDGRVICLLGRSMLRNSNIARSLNYLNIDPAHLVKPQRLDDYDPDEILIACTGSQGEPLAALTRIAWGNHPKVELSATDTVILSSRTIPGNEVRVHETLNRLSKAGATAFHDGNAPVHVSGHAAAEELKTLLQLVRPKSFMPVHGEWRHLHAHADLARAVGVGDNLLITENGFVVELRKGRASITGETVHVGMTMRDRSSDDIHESVVEERRQLGGDGLLVVIVRIREGRAHEVEIISRGFVQDDEDLEDEVRLEAQRVVQTAENDSIASLQEAVRVAITELVHNRTRRSPLVQPVVMTDE